MTKTLLTHTIASFWGKQSYTYDVLAISDIPLMVDIYLTVMLYIIYIYILRYTRETFYEMEISTSLVGIEQKISRLHTKLYFYIAIPYENGKRYEFKMSNKGHFEFNDLLGNDAIYSLAYGRNGFSTKKNI